MYISRIAKDGRMQSASRHLQECASMSSNRIYRISLGNAEKSLRRFWRIAGGRRPLVGAWIGRNMGSMDKQVAMVLQSD